MYDDVVNGKAWAIRGGQNTPGWNLSRKGDVQGSQDGLECGKSEVSHKLRG